MRLFLVLFLLLLLQLPARADVTVVTYNMAQLKKHGLDLVACTKRRVNLQVEAMFNDPASPIFATRDFVFLIQESWTKRSFKALKKLAQERGYTIFPDDHKIVKNSGQLIITNLATSELKSVPFSKDKYAKKGMVYARLALEDGKFLGVINVHTTYSDKEGFSEEHRRHFEELGQMIELEKPLSDYFVVGGDFNAGPDMGFKQTKYDAPATVWEHGLMPLMYNQNMRLLESVGITWDDTHNELVNNPPLLLRLVNKYKNGYIGWDQTDSTLDHIFVKSDMSVLRHELSFTQKVPLKCGRRNKDDGLLNLSDHYGVMAVIKTGEVPETIPEIP